MAEQIVWHPDRKQMERSRLHTFIRKHNLKDYSQLFRKSIADVAWFWEALVKDLELEWDAPYAAVLDTYGGKLGTDPSGTSPLGWKWAKWFSGGKFNLTRNAVDRHANGKLANKTAIVWESEQRQTRSLSYQELFLEINRVANALKFLGIVKGDRVGIFMPMTPDCVIATLACSKIGALFTPIFSGYGAQAIAARLNDCEAKLLFTSDGFYRRGKLVAMKRTADEALKLSPSVKHCIVSRRANSPITWNSERDLEWKTLLRAQSPECNHEATDAEDPYMIIYTSGTTGKPKGTVHAHCGFPLKAAMDLAYHFDIQSSDTLFWFTDMGWMMGPWEVAGVLTLGGTVFLYDGVPDYPEPDRLWELVAEHRITALGLSPTVIRALMRHPVALVKRYDLSSLRVLGSTGEPWNPEAWNWYFDHVGGKKCPIINYSGGTEIGGGILACSFLQPLKPCSFAGPALGMDADVVDENGKPVRGEVGELVIRKPWIGMTRGFWNDPERYESTYWSRFPDTWVHGDWARIDEDGFWFIEGRSDDTIKVAGKRIGPAEIESAFTCHAAVSEAAAIGVPDELKGETAICFVVLKPDRQPDDSLRAELQKHAETILGKAVAPDKILFVKEIPKTRNGKIMRRVIRAKHLGLEDLGDLSGLDSPSALQAIENAT